MKRVPNEEQQAVINDLDNNIILFASAGTGKTYTVANRIRNVLDLGKAKPEDILCVTFTVKACNEMLEDIGTYVGIEARRIQIKTIHGCCFFILKEEAKRKSDNYIDLDVCDDIDEEDILYRMISEKFSQWKLNYYVVSNHISSLVSDVFNYNVINLSENSDFPNLAWDISDNGSNIYLSSQDGLVTRKEPCKASRIRMVCPECKRTVRFTNNYCPECGFDLRTYIEPYQSGLLNKSPKSLRNIASAVKNLRYELNKFSEDAFRDYMFVIEELFNRKQLIHNLFSYYDRGIRKEIYDTFFADDFKAYGALLMCAYDNHLHDCNMVDFDDIIINCALLLKDPNNRAYWQNKYKYITIDEMQDTSQVEYDALEGLFYNNNVMMCGDFFQTIYGWRGSKPEVVLYDFIEKYHAKRYMFRENYRATKTLANASFGYLKKTYPQLIGEYCPEILDINSTENGEPLDCVFLGSQEQQALFIYDYFISHRPVDLSTVCIMARSNNVISEIYNMLTKISKIRQPEERLSFFTVEKGLAFYKTAAIKDLLAFIRILFNNTDNTSIDRLAERFIGGVGKATLSKIHSSGSVGVSMSSFICQDTYDYSDSYYQLIQAAKNNDIVVYDTETTGLDLSKDQAIQIAAIRYDSNGKIKDTFEKMVIPTVEISSGARATIPFDVDEEIKNKGISAKDAYTSFSEFVKGTVLVGHNSIKYDAALIRRQLSELNMPQLSIKAEFDTLSMSKQFYPDLPNHKLGTLCEHLGIVNEEAHNAFGDVKATGDILFCMLRDNIIPNTYERTKILKKYSQKFIQFYKFTEILKKYVERNDVEGLFKEIINTCHLATKYKTESSQNAVYDVLNMVHGLSVKDANTYLEEFIDNAAFSGSQIDSLIKKLNQIPIITVHQSKGCEFDTVIIANCDSLSFPSFAAVKSGQQEEEKRVFYVAISRAKKKLVLTYYYSKYTNESPYIHNIPGVNYQ